MAKSDNHKSGHMLAHMRRYFITGTLILLPLVVSLVLAKTSVDYLNSTVGTWLPDLVKHFTDTPLSPNWNRYFQLTGYVAVITIILATGMIASWAIGRRFIAMGERFMAKIPFISRIYMAVRQIRDALVERQGAVFLYTVLTEYPRRGVYVIGFVTAEDCTAVIEGDYVGVFIPTTPNPTSGYLTFIPRDDVTRLDMGTEDAMKLIISGAAYMPEAPEGNGPQAVT